MNNDMEVDDYFIRMMRESATHPSDSMSLLSKQMKGYVLDRRKRSIATSRHPAGFDQFTEAKYIHNGTMKCNRPNVRDNYIAQLERKDQHLFGTGDKGPLKSFFRHMDFKPLVFGSFGDTSTNVKQYIELAVDYGSEHLGIAMAATTLEVVKTTMRRRYKSQLSTANRGDLANLVLDRTKYMGTCQTGFNKAQIRQK
jgi:hypothetical protein